MKNVIVLFFFITLCSTGSFAFEYEGTCSIFGKEYLATSQTPVSSPTKKMRWTKNVWSTINKSDTSNKELFLPVNENIGFDNASYLGYDSGNNKVRLELIEEQKEAIQFNIWNILNYHFLKGELTIHTPYDPQWQATRDNGFLLFPITAEKYGNSKEGNFSTDLKFQKFIIDSEVICVTDYSTEAVAISSILYPDEDSIDNNGMTLYYPREIFWYVDKDIILLKLKESWTIDETGTILNKAIDAICPVVNQRDQNGNVIGEKELFWIDYNELTPILENYYILKGNGSKKVFSYKEYFSERKFNATVIKEDSIHVKKKK